jgi:hypothetical protein
MIKPEQIPVEVLIAMKNADETKPTSYADIMIAAISAWPNAEVIDVYESDDLDNKPDREVLELTLARGYFGDD